MNCMRIQETFKFWNLVQLILEVLRCSSSSSVVIVRLQRGQCWLVSWSLKFKLKWNLNQIQNYILQHNTFKNVVFNEKNFGFFPMGKGLNNQCNLLKLLWWHLHEAYLFESIIHIFQFSHMMCSIFPLIYFTWSLTLLCCVALTLNYEGLTINHDISDTFEKNAVVLLCKNYPIRWSEMKGGFVPLGEKK